MTAPHEPEQRLIAESVRGRVRVLKPHTAVTTGDEGWDKYHEWVTRNGGMNDHEYLDKLGRRNNGGWIRWDYWRCNNSDCGALALVSAVAVEDIVRTWLPAHIDGQADG